MTTAPDLPLEFGAPASAAPAVPPQSEPAPPRPSLALVPDISVDDAIEDFEDALRLATPRLRRYATRRLQDPHEAEEVVQEAMLRAFQHRGTLRTHDDLMAWLTVVTGRLVIDRVRVRGRMTPVAELPPTARTGRDTADVVVARDEARIALDALEAMPARQASVLWAREVDGLSYDEISERFGLSEPTVRSLLHRARRTLRREYADRGGTLPTLGLVALAPWLHGLRSVGRLRELARRTAAGAVATATAVTIATVAPLWSHPAHDPVHASSAPAPAVVMKADTAASPSVSGASLPRAAAHRPATAVAVPSHPEASHQTAITIPHPSCATTHDAGIGCSTPRGPELFVKLPGSKAIGVSNDLLPLDCTSLPTTALTHCESAPATGSK